MIIFECLSFLDTEQMCIIEIKLTNPSACALHAKRNQWLLISKDSQQVRELHFSSMDSSHEIEERFFDLGYLKFDSKKGIYISKEPTAIHPIENTSCEEVPNTIMETIAKYLNGDGITFFS